MGHRAVLSSSRTRSQVSATAERSHRLRTRQLVVLSHLDCLSRVPADELEPLVDRCVLRVFLAGETILTERKPEEFFFLVLEGNVRLTMHNKEDKQVLLGVLSRGDCCGEGVLFGDFSGRVGACAETDGYLLQLSTVEVRSLLSTSPHLSEALRRPHLHRLVEGTLAHGPLFSQVLPLERLSLAPLLEPVHYPRNCCIIHQGDQGQALYVIESGQVVVEQDGQVVAFLDEGDFFGEIALICQRPHSASVRTLTPTDVLCLAAPRFYEMMAQHPDFEAQLRSLARLRQMADQVRMGDTERVHRLELTLSHGLRRGSRLLVRSPGLCPPRLPPVRGGLRAAPRVVAAAPERSPSGGAGCSGCVPPVSGGGGVY
ncbi:MAG: cyclic nucleotide-binding domain-containing protein [Chloroflexaceae bacterium]|nr:cyclic nucleotide-binding domain-containing protein [Chloroflexaceae bacterium]